MVSVTSVPATSHRPSGTPITPLVVGGVDSSSAATVGYGATGCRQGSRSIPSSGTISGTPSVAGTYPVIVTATDGAGLQRHHLIHLGDHPTR